MCNISLQNDEPFFNLVYNLTLYVFFFKQHTKLNANSLIKLKYI